MAPRNNPAPPQVRRFWLKKLKALDEARIASYEAYLVGIAEAYDAGVSLQAISTQLGNIHLSTAGQYRDWGNDVKADHAKGLTSHHLRSPRHRPNLTFGHNGSGPAKE